MSAEPVLSRAERRRLIAGVVGRSLATAVLLGLLYVLMPVGDVAGFGVVMRLVLCLAAFFAVLLWQVRSVLRNNRPRLRAVQALVGAIMLLIVSFAYLYVTISVSSPGSFSEVLNRGSSIYFTTTVLSTTGFGDIVPVTAPARFVVTVQMALDLLLVAIIVRVLFFAARRASGDDSIAAGEEEL